MKQALFNGEKLFTLLDWKDCLVKCVVLFHSKVDRFMQLLLSSHHLLGNIKQHVINMKFNDVDHFMPTSSYGLRKMTLNISQTKS